MRYYLLLALLSLIKSVDASAYVTCGSVFGENNNECACTNDNFDVADFGNDLHLNMIVKRGSICVVHVPPIGGPLTGQHLLIRPSSGVSGISGKAQFAYKASPTFSGKGHFVISISGLKMRSNIEATSKLYVDVDVQ